MKAKSWKTFLYALEVGYLKQVLGHLPLPALHSVHHAPTQNHVFMSCQVAYIHYLTSKQTEVIALRCGERRCLEYHMKGIVANRLHMKDLDNEGIRLAQVIGAVGI